MNDVNENDNKSATPDVSKGDVLLSIAVKTLEQIISESKPFRSVGVAGSQIMPQEAKGVIFCVHNPAPNAAQTITITDDTNPSQTPVFSAQLATGESRQVYIAFHRGLIATSGTAFVVSGEATVPE